MRIVSLLSAGFGLVLLLIGGAWLALAVGGALQAQAARDITPGLALLFQSYGPLLLTLGLVLCALAGIESTLAAILKELRRARPES